MLEQIEHVDLSEKVYEILKEMIFKRQFTGGQKLDLNLLSEKMNISRTPIKDAINRLAGDGLVEVMPRKGTYVKKIKIKDIVDMMEMRLMMEHWAIRHLSDRKIHQVIEKLESNIQESGNVIRTEPFDYNSFLNLDSEFHSLIVFGHGNERMGRTYKSMNAPFQIARVFYFKNYERSIRSQEEHEEIFQALKSLDLRKAMELLTSHLEVSKNKMITILEENEGQI